MQALKKLHLLQLFFLVEIFVQKSVSQESPVSYCGSIRIQEPFLHQNSSSSLILRHMILCKSEKLYFRTSVGLFLISSIDYTNKLLTVPLSSCFCASDFVTPQLLSAGFPPASSPTSVVLLNCSDRSLNMLSVPCTGTQLSACYGSSDKFRKQEPAKRFSSCSFVDDVGKLERNFHPGQLNCTHYSLVYRNNENFELGMKITFDIPNHIPDLCKQCRKPDGNCGAALNCVCHPIKCKDKVVSAGAVLKPTGDMLFCFLVFVIIVM